MLSEVVLAALLPFFHHGPAPQAMPIDGAWGGPISGMTATYVGVTVLPGGSALVHYSGPIECDGTWHELSHAGNTWTYRETIVYQYQSVYPPAPACPDSNTVSVTLSGDGASVQFSASGSATASGQLTNVRQKEALGPDYAAFPE
jgi:hypothetical protein